MPNLNPNSNQSPNAKRTSDFPRNIYSFSSARAKRDLSARSTSTTTTRASDLANSSTSPSCISSALSTAPASLQTQIELFEQQNLFGADFDVIDELTFNPERYRAFGPEKVQVTAYGVPSIVSYNLDRIRKTLNDANAKIGAQPIISCCLSFGISQLYKNPHVRDLADFREKLLEDHIANSGRDVIEFYHLLRSFKIQIPDDSAGLSSEKINVLVPEWLGQNLGGLSNRLGAPASSLIIICVMIALSIQPTTIDAHKKQLTNLLDMFLRRVELRKRIASVLLEML